MKQYQLDNIAPSGQTYELTNVTFTKLPDTHAFDKKVTFNFPSVLGGTPEVYFIRNSGDYIAFKTASGWSFSLNKSTGALKYESIGQSRRIRVMVSGELSEEGTYSSVTNLSGFVLEGLGSSPWDSFATANGNPTSGVATAAYKMESTTFANYDGCSADSCNASDRIVATQAQVDALATGASSDQSAFAAKKRKSSISALLICKVLSLTQNIDNFAPP